MSRVYEPDAKWQDMADAGIIPQAGNAQEYDVSGWRRQHPERDDDCCIQCLFCWIYCPDNAVMLNEDNEVFAFSDEHCKACGICAQVCPKDCIEMKKGSEFPEDQIPGDQKAKNTVEFD
ncbi:MAG: 4Fe-4S dicluster-binding protein [Armatimonadota bacterium]